MTYELIQGNAYDLLDPFAGSASLGKACQKLGYHYIGVELDPHYYNIALNTLQPYTYQLPLSL